ncbi:MAG: carboxypeptidase-like regulatory domain-containing protein, partial [Lewinella sp.]|nr:carboxypeptidase-like regulatory domain-containing protein [Lewinella sp.]
MIKWTLYLLLTLGLYTVIQPATAPEVTIRGCVTDETGEPLIGANVLLKGTDKGTVTDFEGCFTLEVPADQPTTLMINYVGYAQQEIKVDDPEHPLSISMAPGDEVLDEVVVTGYSRGRGARALSHRVAAPAPATAPAMLTDDAMLMDYAPEKMAVSGMASPAAEPLPGSALVERSGGSTPQAAGQLTAGELSDFSKWEMWADISQEDLAAYRSVWELYPDHRYTLQLTNDLGLPVVNATVRLRDGQGNNIWTARTDHGGRAELWAHCFKETREPANGLVIV